MKLINQNAELLIQQDWKKQIELAARTCYKSEDRTEEGTAEVMLERLINSRHFSMLEHGTIYLHCHSVSMVTLKIYNKYYFNPYSRAKISTDKNDVYITTNYRVIKEHGWKDDLKYLCEPTDNHVKRYTFRLTTSIGIVRELLRHRVFSFANESTRYCNYSKDSFNSEITCIIPHWLEINNEVHIDTPAFIDKTYGMKNIIQAGITEPEDIDFISSLLIAEQVYLSMLVGDMRIGRSPQQAREVLPLCTKSELIMTGFEDDWEDFLDKRLRGTTGKPHPDMIILAQLIENEIKETKK